MESRDGGSDDPPVGRFIRSDTERRLDLHELVAALIEEAASELHAAIDRGDVAAIGSLAEDLSDAASAIIERVQLP